MQNLTRDTVLADRAWAARGAWQRTRGLLGTAGLDRGQGLIIEPCNSVHMMGMRYPLDLVFADGEHRVKRVIQGLRPWRFSPLVWGARYVIELPVGAIAATGTAPGDRLHILEMS